MTRHIRELEHGRLASSPANQSKVKRDLSKDLDALEDTENDGFDQLMIKEMNSAALEDFLTENNSHLGDICPLKSRKKSIYSKIKPVPKKKDRDKNNQENKGFKIKGIFWNSIGLCDLAKFIFLSDTSRVQNLDFIALL